MAKTEKVYEYDPIQGHDVCVTTSSYAGVETGKTDGSNGSPMNAFTDILVKVVVQTETYLPMSRKAPRFLDGEVIIVWSASGGVLDFHFIEETFGQNFANSIDSESSKTRIQRSNRFSITATLDVGETSLNNEEAFNNPYAGDAGDGTLDGKQRLKLLYCRCDTLTFGVQAGKGYAVNSWQGTAEGIRSPNINYG